jgi:hypothetical protein
VIQFASIILFHAALESCPIPSVKKKVQLLMDRLIIIGGQQYERDVPMGSIEQCQSEATRVVNKAANIRVATTTDAAEIGAGCVIKINPGNPA